MVTDYEATYIIDTNLPEEQATGIIDKYRGVVTNAGGTVDDVDVWEPRRLAFEVKGRREGVYVVMNFRSEPAAKDELDRIFRISDDAIRHLIIKQDPSADRAPSLTRRAEYDRREREAAARAEANAAAAAPAITEIPAEPTAAVPDPQAATDAVLPPVPAYAETAEAQDPQADVPAVPTDEPDAVPDNKQTPETPDPAPPVSPDEEVTGTNDPNTTA